MVVYVSRAVVAGKGGAIERYAQASSGRECIVKPLAVPAARGSGREWMHLPRADISRSRALRVWLLSCSHIDR